MFLSLADVYSLHYSAMYVNKRSDYNKKRRPYSCDCCFYKCWPVSILFGTRCTELICNTSVLLLHYLGKQVKCI